MKKLVLLIVLALIVAAAYSFWKEPGNRDRFLSTIEKSTGVDLSIENAGRAAGNAAKGALSELGETLSDPSFHKALERWGRDARDALEKLDSTVIERLKRDLKAEADGGGNYDAVLEKYLKGSGSS